MRLLGGYSRAGAVRLTGALVAAVAVAACCVGVSSAAAGVSNVPAPTVWIEAPPNEGIYLQGTVVATKFSCTESEEGSGLESCTDSNGGSGTSGVLETSTLGPHTYTVTAKSEDGETGTASIGYTVVESICTGDSGTVTLKPGLTDRAAVQRVEIKGALTGCTAPLYYTTFTAIRYTAKLITAGPVSCSVLTGTGETAAGEATYRFTPTAIHSSTGFLSMPLTATPDVAFTAVAARIGLVLTGTATERYTGAATCGKQVGKKKAKPVKKGTFSGVISGISED